MGHCGRCKALPSPSVRNSAVLSPSLSPGAWSANLIVSPTIARDGEKEAIRIDWDRRGGQGRQSLVCATSTGVAGW